MALNEKNIYTGMHNGENLPLQFHILFKDAKSKPDNFFFLRVWIIHQFWLPE